MRYTVCRGIGIQSNTIILTQQIAMYIIALKNFHLQQNVMRNEVKTMITITLVDFVLLALQ